MYKKKGVNKMLEKEKQEMYIAQCKICLLAENMKCCESCPFNIGLKKEEKNESPK